MWNPNEEVAFDITNGPALLPPAGAAGGCFSALRVKRVDLRAVLYGAFDVGRVLDNGETPMFDLTPMLALLEWSAAADRFNRTGDSRYLASLIAAQRAVLGQSGSGRPGLCRTKPGQLGNLAGALTGISQSLQLIRPVETMESAEGPGGAGAESPPGDGAQCRCPAVCDAAGQHPADTYSPLGMRDPLADEDNLWLVAARNNARLSTGTLSANSGCRLLPCCTGMDGQLVHGAVGKI